MYKTSANALQVESFAGHHHHHLLCWKSVFGGLAIAFMALLALTSLGAGVAGLTAESLINKNEGGGSAMATIAGLWLGLSVVISLFCGAYFALRISRFVTTRIGAAHGFVIASLFFFILVAGAGKILGGVAKGLGNLTQTAAEGASSLGSSPFVQDSVNKAFGSTNLKSDPQTVAQGLTVRLLQGDTESAKSYYAYQTGLSQTEVDTKVTQLQNDFNAAVKKAEEKTAAAVGDAGLTLFVLFLVGLGAALFGGRVGAQANVQRPFAKMEETHRSERFETAHA